MTVAGAVHASVDAACVPLVVDVDGTLIKTDLLHEAALQMVARHPFQAWRMVAWLAGGKAALKAQLAERIDPGTDSIPLRDETVARIASAQAGGRPVYLASASDRRWVEPIARRVGGIAGVMASDGAINLAGPAKARALVEAFGERGFDYIGDHRVDFPVWSSARRPLVVAHSGGFERAVLHRFPEADVVARPRTKLRAAVKAMRVHQWAKNVLVLLPIVAGHSFFDPHKMLAALLAFACFCLAASSTYIVNDLLDLPGDRDHVRKRFRPFAAGALSAIDGLGLSALLMIAAALLALALPIRFAGVLGSYVVLTLAYSLVLKRRMLVDIIMLGGLYTLRVFGGVAASRQPSSAWLLVFSLFLFFSLAAVKRCSELVARRSAGKPAPLGRGYRIEDLAVLFPMAAGAGYGAVLVVALYLSSPDIAMLYRHPMRMWLICPLILFWISRVLMLSNRDELHDDPVIFALRDRVSWLTALFAGGVIAVSI